MGPGAGEHPPDPVLAQLGLQLSGGEPAVLIPRHWSLPVSGDKMMLFYMIIILFHFFFLVCAYFVYFGGYAANAL